MTTSSAALMGAAGGVGTTRTAVEVGATLARAGHDVVILDAAFATQGLSRHVTGRLIPEMTAVLTEGRSPREALQDHPYDEEMPGRLALLPAFAPFEGLARAQSVEAAQRLETVIESLEETFDVTLVDTPPLASNPAVSAVTTTDVTAVITTATPRGVDALQQSRERLTDVGASADVVVGNRVPDGETMPDADVQIPSGAVPPAGDAPAAFDPGHSLAPAIGFTAETVLDRPLDLRFERGLLESTRQRFD